MQLRLPLRICSKRPCQSHLIIPLTSHFGSYGHFAKHGLYPRYCPSQLAAYAIWDFSARSGAPARVVLLYLGTETGLSVDLTSLLFCPGSQLLHPFLIVQLHGVRPFGHLAGIIPEIDLEPGLRLTAFRIVMTGPPQPYVRPRHAGLDHLPSHSVFSTHTWS